MTRRSLAALALLVALTGSSAALAIDGYVVDKATGIGYRLVYQAQSWPVARDRCEEEGAKLAVPKTLDEYLFMQKLVRGMSYSAVAGSADKLLVWLGIHNLDDYRVWRNVDGENIDKTGFHKWSRGNGEGYSDAVEEPHCAGLDAVNWLRDFWCHRRQPYICQIKLNTTDYYTCFFYPLTSINISALIRQTALILTSIQSTAPTSLKS